MPTPSAVVRPIEYDSPEYHAARDLRRRFLREPLGLELTEADVAGEDAQHHFGLFEPAAEGAQPRLLGAAIGKPAPDLGPDAVRIRQVVIDDTRRGQGLGRLLMEGVEAGLGSSRFRRFVLFARPEAARFYERCGYTLTGETAELIGLEHGAMEKRL